MAPAWPIRLPDGGFEPGDVGDDRLRDMFADVRGGALLVVPTDLPRHDHQIGAGVPLEQASDSMNPIPCTGSPPIPIQVDWPIPSDVSSYTI